MKVKTKFDQIHKKLASLREELKALQEECTHPGKTSIYKSDTGNWSPSDNRYWVEHFCPDCGKLWKEDVTPKTH